MTAHACHQTQDLLVVVQQEPTFPEARLVGHFPRSQQDRPLGADLLRFPAENLAGEDVPARLSGVSHADLCRVGFARRRQSRPKWTGVFQNRQTHPLVHPHQPKRGLVRRSRSQNDLHGRMVQIDPVAAQIGDDVPGVEKGPFQQDLLVHLDLGHHPVPVDDAVETTSHGEPDHGILDRFGWCRLSGGGTGQRQHNQHRRHRCSRRKGQAFQGIQESGGAE